jgi:hypothetical protein
MAATTQAQKPDTPKPTPVTRLSVNIPEETMRAIRQRKVDTDSTIEELVSSVLVKTFKPTSRNPS